MSSMEERSRLARGRALPGGLTAAVERMRDATAGAATTLTEAQLEVLTLLAFGVATVRDLCAARGLGRQSTNAISEHTAALEVRGLVERLRPRDGTAYRYAPWLLTSAGWRTLGPCSCSAHLLADVGNAIDEALEAAMGETTRQGGALGNIAIEATGVGRSAARSYLRNRWGIPPITMADGTEVAPFTTVPRPPRYCTWCGWRLW